MERTVAHVDMDAFYASCHIRETPDIKGLPVIIGGDPEKGRGVVTTCSYEAREYGIHSAMPISRAFQLCPGGVYLRPDFQLYKSVSENVMGILAQFADVFQRAGIDEAYLDVTRRVTQYQTPYHFAQAVQHSILTHECITCSVGIAPSKSVAKIASDFRKPHGVTVVPQEDVLSFLRPLPVEKISGVGKKTRQVLNDHGITTIEQLEKTDVAQLERILGKSGSWLWVVANAKDERPVGYRGSVHSMGKEHTFAKDTKNVQDIFNAVEWIAERLARRLHQRTMEFRTVSVKVRLKEFRTYNRSRTLPYHVDGKDVIIAVSRELFQEFRGEYIRLLGIRLTNLRATKTYQETLLQWF
ncbi:MAG: DNA polymerase IV [Theionarchaea archaeon]|nr:DNA polymerase IV [Theionarchaea archaeon]MBU7001190.1 DNA polymerase IV [Theionarchaea archaeon]MBU7019970.1 DNA polymerase IV [Theionarchaea archaeon]MBU7034061.1 DNA polymerase IV [Theionarchaea archaeon]MBU7039596.1 DNA polymerase IV [Theionarchaea archaeon]